MRFKRISKRRHRETDERDAQSGINICNKIVYFRFQSFF